MAEANFNVADDFESGEEEMAVFLLNQSFDESVFSKKGNYCIVTCR